MNYIVDNNYKHIITNLIQILSNSFYIINKVVAIINIQLLLYIKNKNLRKLSIGRCT